MCSYAGKEIVDLCRSIANQEGDLKELLRVAREKAPGLITAARAVLERQGDQRALKVLDRVMGREVDPLDDLVWRGIDYLRQCAGREGEY